MAYPSDLTRTKNWNSEVLTDADLEGQFDLIINWAMASLNATTGHTHDGTTNNGPKIPITNMTVGSQAQGDTIYASSATAWARLGAGTAGQALTTGGAAANPAWAGMTTEGDIEYRSATTRTRLAKGTAFQQLRMNTGATAPEWFSGFEVVTGSYTGDGVDDREITIGFTNTSKVAKFVHVTTATTEGATMITGMTNGYVAGGTSQANSIQSISTANEFQVGTDSSVNSNGVAYKFIAIG